MSEAKEKTVPAGLAALIAAFGEKLTGEQIRECLEQAHRSSFAVPNLTHQQEYACRAVLADGGMAEWYGYERSSNLEQLRSLRNKCDAALKAFTKPAGSYSFEAELHAIRQDADDALKKWHQLQEEIVLCLSQIDSALITAGAIRE